MRVAVALRLGRISNLPTVWTNVLAGIALAGGPFDAPTLLALMVSTSLVYVAGMYLNDWFDRAIDARERPSRPIPSGAASASQVLGAGIGLLAFGVMLSGAAGSASPAGSGAKTFAAALALAACVVAYDAVHKRTPLAVLLMASCRALLIITAALATAPQAGAAVLAGAAGSFAYITGLTAVARHETRRRIGALWPLALLAAPVAIALWLGRSEPAAVAFSAAFGAWAFFAVRPLLGADADVGLAVSRMLAGICLLDAALIAGRGHLALAVLAALGTTLTRLLQRYVPGT